MLVSIITPCLNSEATIRQTIESVLNQTYKNIEYIIVDGGSTDGTVDIIKEYVPLFCGRMRYVSEPDKGIYDAMNKGIRKSRGQLIGIINSDDWYEPDAVEKILRNMTGDRHQVVYGYCTIIENNHIRGISKNNHMMLARDMIPHPTCFITRNVYRDFGMFLTAFKVSSDYELIVRLYRSRKVTFTQVKEIIAHYRLGGASSDSKRVTIESAPMAYYHKMITLGELVKMLAGIMWRA